MCIYKSVGAVCLHAVCFAFIFHQHEAVYTRSIIFSISLYMCPYAWSAIQPPRHHIKRCTDATPQLHSHSNPETEPLLVPTHSTGNDLHTTAHTDRSQGSWRSRGGGVGGLQHERVKGSGRGETEMKRERTVVELSSARGSSRRKRPLSFDCELNHDCGAILK